MKKGTGVLIALLAAAAGAVAAVFAIKKRNELEQYDYDEYFEDCDCEDCDCEECDCEDCDCEDCGCGCENDGAANLDDYMPSEEADFDEEVALDAMEDEIENIEKPIGSDF